MNQLWGVNGGCCRAVKVCVVAQLEMPQSMSFPLDYYNRELAGKPKGMKCMLKERGLWPERGLVLECPTTHIDQAVLLRVAAALAGSLRQNGTSRIRKAACKRRSEHWAAECFFTLSIIVSLILSSATGAEQNGLQEKTVSSTLKHSRQVKYAGSAGRKLRGGGNGVKSNP